MEYILPPRSTTEVWSYLEVTILGRVENPAVGLADMTEPKLERELELTTATDTEVTPGGTVQA